MADINLMDIKINIPQVAIEDYSFIIAGTPKAGKTSLFVKMLKEYYGDVNSGLLLALEKGYSALKVKAQDIDSLDDFNEAVEQLVDNKEELPFKVIAVDTIDILWEYAQDAVIKEWNIKNPTKRTTDISVVGSKGKSDSGFGIGYSRARQKIRGQIDKLIKAGYGVWFITHSKDKEVTEKDGEKYDQLVVSLPGSAREVFINMADFIIFVTVEKEKDKTTGGAIAKRYMYWRSNGFIEAGGRFTQVPEKIEYDVKDFIEVFKSAVEAELEDENKSIEEIAEEQQQVKEEKTKAYIEEHKRNKNDEVNDITISNTKETTTTKDTKDTKEYTLEEMLIQLETKAKELRAKKVRPIDIKKVMNNNRNFDFVKDLKTAKQVMENLIALEQE